MENKQEGGEKKAVWNFGNDYLNRLGYYYGSAHDFMSIGDYRASLRMFRSTFQMIHYHFHQRDSKSALVVENMLTELEENEIRIGDKIFFRRLLMIDNALNMFLKKNNYLMPSASSGNPMGFLTSEYGIGGE